MEEITYPVNVHLPEVPMEVYQGITGILAGLKKFDNQSDITPEYEKKFLVISNYIWYIDQYLYSPDILKYLEIGDSLRLYAKKYKDLCTPILEHQFKRNLELFYRWIAPPMCRLDPISMYDGVGRQSRR